MVPCPPGAAGGSEPDRRLVADLGHVHGLRPCLQARAEVGERQAEGVGGLLRVAGRALHLGDLAGEREVGVGQLRLAVALQERLAAQNVLRGLVLGAVAEGGHHRGLAAVDQLLAHAVRQLADVEAGTGVVDHVVDDELRGPVLPGLQDPGLGQRLKHAAGGLQDVLHVDLAGAHDALGAAGLDVAGTFAAGGEALSINAGRIISRIFSYRYW